MQFLFQRLFWWSSGGAAEWIWDFNVGPSPKAPVSNICVVPKAQYSHRHGGTGHIIPSFCIFSGDLVGWLCTMCISTCVITYIYRERAPLCVYIYIYYDIYVCPYRYKILVITGKCVYVYIYIYIDMCNNQLKMPGIYT